jgi:D-glycero-D-manno-heptose 1,7-bisphosphate phosphatase
MARRALFLDRDGTLIVDVGYPRDPEAVELVDGAADALRALQQGWALVVISNQSGIGRGLISEQQATAVHERFVARFAALGVRFAGFYYCPHAPDAGCACRKPAPGLLRDAAAELGLDLARSVMIGDKASDIEAGRAAGCAYVVRLGPDVDQYSAPPFGGAARSGEAGPSDAARPSARFDDWAEVQAFVASLGEAG